MALVTRLDSSGNFSIPSTGIFDEYTQPAGITNRVDTSGNFFVKGVLDEYTINPKASGLVRKIYSNGDYAISGIFDEVTGFGYTLTSGNKAAVFGAASAATWPPSGWTSIQDVSVDDGFLSIALPFTWTFNGTGYTTIYVGSNFYITFGAGSSNYSGLSASNPANDKIMKNAADRSYQRVATFTSGTNFVRVRFEGGSTTGGTPGSSDVIYEATFFNPTNTGGLPTVEFLLGNDTTSGSGTSGIYSSSALLTGGTWTPAATTSYVMQGTTSSATAWTISTSYYMAGTGY